MNLHKKFLINFYAIIILALIIGPGIYKVRILNKEVARLSANQIEMYHFYTYKSFIEQDCDRAAKIFKIQKNNDTVVSTVELEQSPSNELFVTCAVKYNNGVSYFTRDRLSKFLKGEF